jgi:drug/metabolite transporter (DMT)-like permease
MPHDETSTSQQRLAGRLLVIVSAILWSTSAWFVKAPIFSNDWPVEWRAIIICFWRAVFACLILGLMVRRVSFCWQMIVMSFFFVVMNITFLSALVEIEAAATIWLQYTAPAWVFLGSFLLIKERVTRGDCLLLAFASLGVIVILIAELSAGKSSVYGITLALLSGVSYAAVVLSLRFLRGHDSAWLIFLNHLLTAIVLLPCVVWLGEIPRGSEWLFLAGLGIFQMGLPYLLFAQGVRRIPGHEASLIVLIEPILLPLWVFLFWSKLPDYQPPAWGTLAGGGLILAGLIVRFLLRGRYDADIPRIPDVLSEPLE